jgi:hypothetical protein
MKRQLRAHRYAKCWQPAVADLGVVRRMHPSRVRPHAMKIVDYAIRAAFFNVVAIPLSFFLSMSGGLGSESPEHGEEIFAVGFFIAIAPAHCVLWRSSAPPRPPAARSISMPNEAIQRWGNG